MSASNSPYALELTDYLTVLRRRWRVVLVLTCCGLLAGAAVVTLAAKEYTATASVYVTELSGGDNQAVGGLHRAVNMDNEADVVQSQTVAELASRRLRPRVAPSVLGGRVSVAVPPNTTVLNISCRASSADRAAACANAIAAAYLSVRLAGATDPLSHAVGTLRSSRRLLAEQIGKLDSALRGRPSSSPAAATGRAELKAAGAQLGTVVSRLNTLEPELAARQAPGNTLAGHIITPAKPPASPSSPRTLLIVVSGLLAGLIIGLLAAFLKDHRDERLRTPRDVERALDLPVLLSTGAQDAGPSQLEGAGPVAELAGFAAAGLGENGQVIVVAAVGTATGAGAWELATRLATTLADAHSEVLLVPRLPGASDEAGLAEPLAGHAAMNEVARPAAGVESLRVVSAGKASGGPLGLGHDAVRRVLSELRSTARYVVIETALGPESPHAYSVAALADAAILVIETSETKRSEAIECLHRLDRLATVVLCAVMVAPSSAEDRSASAIARDGRRGMNASDPAAARAAGQESTAVATDRPQA